MVTSSEKPSTKKGGDILHDEHVNLYVNCVGAQSMIFKQRSIWYISISLCIVLTYSDLDRGEQEVLDILHVYPGSFQQKTVYHF